MSGSVIGELKGKKESFLARGREIGVVGLGRSRQLALFKMTCVLKLKAVLSG